MKSRGFENLNKIERKILVAMGSLGMRETETCLKIEFVYGFELFGAYETWRGGFVVTDAVHGVKVQAEHLDDAIILWQERLIEKYPELARRLREIRLVKD